MNETLGERLSSAAITAMEWSGTAFEMLSFRGVSKAIRQLYPERPYTTGLELLENHITASPEILDLRPKLAEQSRVSTLD